MICLQDMAQSGHGTACSFLTMLHSHLGRHGNTRLDIPHHVFFSVRASIVSVRGEARRRFGSVRVSAAGSFAQEKIDEAAEIYSQHFGDGALWQNQS